MNSSTKKLKITSESTLDFVISCMPIMAPEDLFLSYDLSAELTSSLLAKKFALSMKSKDVTFLN